MSALTLFLCGDVMTGRGIDQVLSHSCEPTLYEPAMKSAIGYVTLAEAASGSIPRRVAADYVWGMAFEELDRVRPAARIINLETAVTDREDPWPKGINYRMHPDNVDLLEAARIDVASLANNHVMDWGIAGLEQTLDTLDTVATQPVGAGRTAAEAWRPAVIELHGQGRVLVLGVGVESSGIPKSWYAGPDQPGLAVLPDLSKAAVARVAAAIEGVAVEGDVVVVSIHWGGNWGYAIPSAHRWFAHRLISEAGADIVHGHSSHHPLGIEVYRDRLILYGCGDLVNDYEGIRGHDEHRTDLGLMYFAGVGEGGELEHLEMTVTQLRRFRLEPPGVGDVAHLAGILDRESRRFGAAVVMIDDRLYLQW